MFKKYKLMFFYMKTIKKYLPEINNYFISNNNKFAYDITSIKIDRIYRIYTVVNLKPYNMKNLQLYGHVYLDNEVEKFIRELNDQLSNIGLRELVGLVKADRVGENNVLIVSEFKFLNIAKIYLWVFMLFLSIISIIIYFFYNNFFL